MGCVCVHLVIGLKIVVEHIDTDGEVSSVVWVGPVPALRSKLPPLNHYSMEVDQREQNALKFILFGAHLQCVLKIRDKLVHDADNGTPWNTFCSEQVTKLKIVIVEK